MQPLAFDPRNLAPFRRRVDFTGAGAFTWIVPDDVWIIFYDGVAGGGGGGNGGGSSGGGGGSCGFGCRSVPLPVIPGMTLTITNGAAGTAGVAGGNNTVSGLPGNMQTFTLYGGQPGTAGSGTTGGNGGVISDGTTTAVAGGAGGSSAAGSNGIQVGSIVLGLGNCSSIMNGSGGGGGTTRNGGSGVAVNAGALLWGISVGGTGGATAGGGGAGASSLFGKGGAGGNDNGAGSAPSATSWGAGGGGGSGAGAGASGIAGFSRILY